MRRIAKHLKARQLVLVAIVSCACIGTLPDSAVAGLPGKMKIGETELVLNGYGARKRSILQLYVAGLYLTEKSGDANAIIDADKPMALRLEVTSQFVSQSNLLSALNEGFQSSTGGDMAPIRTEIEQFRRLFSDSISSGDVFDMVYVPGKGLFVAKNGSTKGAIEGIEFKRALFGIWLSDRPADQGLKRALLGR